MGKTDKGGAINLLLICAGIAAGFFALFYFLVMFPMKMNPAYRQAILITRTDPAAASLLGSQIRTGIFVLANTQTYNGFGEGYMQVALYGSQNRGQLFMHMTKARKSEWVLIGMDIEVDDEVVLDWVPGTGFVYANQPGAAPAGNNVNAPTTAPLATPLP